MNLRKAKQAIRNAKTIVIAGHVNPDGDSIGSLLAIGLALKKVGKKVYMISPDGVPIRYLRLPGAKLILRKTNIAPDLAISVDCSNKDILGEAFTTFVKAKNILEIDHHEFRRPFGNLKFIDYRAASVGELIYILLGELKIKIDKKIAQNILTSIIVETDSFRLPSVTPRTFEICTDLIKKKVDFHKLVEIVFWSRTRNAIILSGVCFSRCRFIKNGKIVWSIVRIEDFKKVKGREEDVDAVADEMRSISEVKIVALFREEPNNKLRVSIRSKENINVGRVAEKYNGGGHVDVAGCTIPDNAHSISRFLKDIEQLVD